MADTELYLVVDLDGTLLRSDMLFESFWSATRRDWRTPFRALLAMREGRAALKRKLVQAAFIDVATLPYSEVVQTYVKGWRAQGGKTVLVTASDQEVADRIAAHLNMFDEAYGSDGVRNLKGGTKAAFLSQQFGEGKYAYIGDSPADLPVWEKSKKAITVDAPEKLRGQVEALGREVEHLSDQPSSVLAYAEAIRPHQWLKNVLVFVPMLAAHQLGVTTVTQSLLAFAAFSLVASSVYVLNDLLDLSADRAHPRKRNRPFAAGSIPIAHGIWMAAGLLLLGAGLSVVLGFKFLMVMVGYYLATTAYSLWLKSRRVVDICLLAGLYTLRIIAGGAATNIVISIWLLAFSTFFFLALAAVKRQAELVDIAKRGDLGASGRGYIVDDLPVVSQMAISAGYVSVLVMALYINSSSVSALYSEPSALWGICLVLLYWISRIAMVAHRGEMHDDPIIYAVKDWISQICGLLIFGFALAGILL